jgi:hypothetical protein
MLAIVDTRKAHVLAQKSSHMFKQVKDELELKVSGIYNIRYECAADMMIH